MKNLVGNDWKDASNGKTVEVYNPATQELLDTVPDSTVDDVIEVVDIAVNSKLDWNTLSLYERGKILKKFAKNIDDDIDDLAILLSKETGNTLNECYEELKNLQIMANLYVQKAKYLNGINMPSSEKDTTIKISVREALGVVVVIIPDNGAVFTFANKVLAALIMGNSVIVKPSVHAPLTITKLVYLLRHVGVSTGAIQIIHGIGKNVGQALAMHPNVNLIAFSGTTATAIKVMAAASKNLTKVTLDLGGNNALILCEDGDVDLAVDETIASRCYNAGQTNSCNKLFLIHSSLKNQYIEKLTKTLYNIRVDLPTNKNTDMGSLITEEDAIRVENQINATVDEGATIIMGGRRKGSFYEPTILDKVTKKMQLVNNLEILGPVIPIIEFNELDEAIAITNQSVYSQGTSIFTNNMKRAFKASKRLKTARVIINASTLIKSMIDPYEGRKYSGMGKQGLEYTLEEMSQVKVTIFNDILE